MAVWTVFVPDEGDNALVGAQWAEQVVLVREKFSWLALLFAPLVLLRHRLWLAVLGYVAFQGGLAFAIHQLQLGDAGDVLYAFAHLVVAFELPALRRAKLTAHGYEEVGALIAPTLDAAEQRFFDGQAGGVPLRTRTPSRTVLGLFPEATGR
ncbi:DUF2628 domain-containing protein [Ancylobacter sp. A5.8]|uniref:DUF2628 domain-containing protein n=1 Tax=Ancylobacter gelatini TaxID=2919920 RepID=UPI001F4E7270|nr:DUF2628 domain-containing protein [Ancylobacter gelatini]MCJ8144444.1 DUF2628 domain-containing protein [Ancylobacter gelatini]